MPIKKIVVGTAVAVAVLTGTAVPASAEGTTYGGRFPTADACHAKGQEYADGGTGYSCQQSFTREWWNLWIYG